uniref:Uncharacterized protein n=1 Tax=Glossina pallidipes TaxID=7398 RepID=A0A1A9ZDS0_GLOPL
MVAKVYNEKPDSTNCELRLSQDIIELKILRRPSSELSVVRQHRLLRKQLPKRICNFLLNLCVYVYVQRAYGIRDVKCVNSEISTLHYITGEKTCMSGEKIHYNKDQKELPESVTTGTGGTVDYTWIIITFITILKANDSGNVPSFILGVNYGRLCEICVTNLIPNLIHILLTLEDRYSKGSKGLIDNNKKNIFGGLPIEFLKKSFKLQTLQNTLVNANHNFNRSSSCIH